MKYDEIIEASRNKKLMADAGAGGGGGGAGAGGGAGSGAGAGTGGGAGPGNSSGGGAHGNSSGGGGSAGSGDTSPSSSTSASHGFFTGYSGYWSPKATKKKKKKKSKVGTVKDGIYEDKKQMEDQLFELKFALTQARNITKKIKYANTHMEVISEMGTLAEKFGLASELEYQEKAVFQAAHRLESACYELEEPFEDAIRDLTNKIDELDLED